MNKTSLFQISFLGNPTIQENQTALSLKRKSLAVFAYVVHQKTAIERKELARLLWPTSEQSKGLKSLTMILNRYPEPIKACLTVTNQTVSFRSEHVWLDLHQFEENLAYAQTILEHEKVLKKTGRTLLEQSLELYKGEFLQGFSLAEHDEFTGWLVQERQKFAKQAFATAAKLFLFNYNHANFEEACRFTEEMLRISPFNEDAHMALMRLKVELGDPKGAIDHFQNYQTALTKELGANPGRKITTYYQELYNPILVPEGRRVTDADFKLIFPEAAKRSDMERKQSEPSNQLTLKPLPQLIVKLFGRETLLAQLQKEITSADNRLFSVTGLGGIGKTQLAIALGHQVASEFKDGVAFIPLRGVDRDQLIVDGASQNEIETQMADQIAVETLSALNISPAQNVSPFFQLIQALDRQEILLIYDNFEHLIEGASFFTSLIYAAADVTILVTSRIRLSQPSEINTPLPPLTFSAADQQNLTSELNLFSNENSGVQLFIDRATRINRQLTIHPEDLTFIQMICELTGGLPLAIEQAASWVSHYTLKEIVSEINQSYTFLMKTSARRDDPHRNIKATLESSFKLLSAAEQKMLQALTILENNFSRDAALAISDEPIDTLFALTDRSLLQQISPGWYTFHPLVYQIAADKYAGQSPLFQDQIRLNYISYFLGIWGEISVNKTLEKSLAEEHYQKLDRIKTDLLQAWHWGVFDQQYELLARGVYAFGVFMEITQVDFQMISWSFEQLSLQKEFKVANGKPLSNAFLEVYTRCGAVQGGELNRRHKREEAIKCLSEVETLAEQANLASNQILALIYLAKVTTYQNDVEQAFNFIEKAREIACSMGSAYQSGIVEVYAGLIYFRPNKDAENSIKHLQLALTYFGNTYQPMLASCYHSLSSAFNLLDDLEKAIEMIEKAIALFKVKQHAIGHYFALAELLLRRGNIDTAAQIISDCKPIIMGNGNPISVFLFYYRKISIDLERLRIDPESAKINLTEDVATLIEWLQDTDYVTEKLFAYSAMVAAHTLQGNSIEAQQAFNLFVTQIKINQRPDKAPPVLLNSFVFVVLYYIDQGFMKQAQDVISFFINKFSQEGNKLPSLYLTHDPHNLYAKKIMDWLVLRFENRFGHPFKVVDEKELPENGNGMTQYLVDNADILSDISADEIRPLDSLNVKRTA